MMRTVSEPIPIPIRDMGGVEEVAAPSPDDALFADAIADVLVEVITASTTALGDLAAERGVPMEGSSERLLRAGAGIAVEGVRAVGAWFAAFERTAADLAANSTAGRSVADHGLAAWARAGDAEHTAGDTSLDALVEAILERLDLTELVRRHLDINVVVEDLDPDPIVTRLDMDALTDRIDIEALVERLDIAAVIDRLDIAALATSVLQELDVAELIRVTAGDATSDEVRQLRLRSVEADQFVQRGVDRVLGRRREQ